MNEYDNPQQIKAFHLDIWEAINLHKLALSPPVLCFSLIEIAVMIAREHAEDLDFAGKEMKRLIDKGIDESPASS